MDIDEALSDLPVFRKQREGAGRREDINQKLTPACESIKNSCLDPLFRRAASKIKKSGKRCHARLYPLREISRLDIQYQPFAFRKQK
jgi:hypothetical protein